MTDDINPDTLNMPLAPTGPIGPRVKPLACGREVCGLPGCVCRTVGGRELLERIWRDRPPARR